MPELEKLRKEAEELHAKRERLEARRKELLDKIAAHRSKKAASPEPVGGSGVFIGTKLVENVLDISRCVRTSITPGVLVCAPSVNAARFEGRRVIFVTNETLKALLDADAIQVLH